MIRFALACCLLFVSGIATAQDAGYYQDPALFSTRPSATASETNITRFGPVGISIDLIQPAFTMRIKSIEEGSPAESAGLLPQMIIESINGQVLADIDPRIQLGHILAQAEATDGMMRFDIRDRDEDIVVTLPVLGAYSDTWPLDCPKSDAIVRGFANYLRTEDADRGFAGIGLLFLVSTGDPDDLALARQWVNDGMFDGNSSYAWYIGYGGIGLCEYYLKTGDPHALELIQRYTDNAVQGQYMDAWAGRGGVLTTYGNGHLNAAGTGCVAFLLLAKECGAEVPDHAMLGALRHFYRYAGRGNNPYGDDRPERGFVDNGKNGYLAFALAAAASLTPEGEDSLYADARDWCANTGFYTTAFMLHGHTGGGIGEIWRSASMAMMHDVRPEQYRDFMDNRAWHYDLSRRFDGSFAILGGEGYDKVQWGAAFTLAYTLPRGHLRIAGAPPTEHSHLYELPHRIWGTEADDAFYLLTPVPDADGNVADLSGETIANDAAMSILRNLHGSEPPTDDQIRYYIRHPYSTMRYIAACKVLGVNSGYIGWLADGGEMRPQLAMELLQSNSPRIRYSMFMATANHGLEPESPLLTREVLALAIAALSDPDESWWVKDAALSMVAKFPAEWTRPHVGLILTYLDHEEDWLKNAALFALVPHVAEPETYERVLPPIGQLLRTNQRWSITSAPMHAIREHLDAAGPEVRELAIATLQESFTGYAGVVTAPGGQDITSTRNLHLAFIAEALADVPGGVNALYDIGRVQRPDEPLPFQTVILNTPPEEYGPALREELRPILLEQVIPKYVGRNRRNLQRYANGEVQSARCGGRHESVPGGAGEVIDELAALYAQAGEDHYDWQMYADLRNAEWDYFTFDVIESEQVPWDVMRCRYREVTLPGGQENWYATDFNPSAAGWRSGRSPFGTYDGEIPDHPIMKCEASCLGPVCFGATPINTLWENEVLMFRQTFELPNFEEGYRYRIRVNDGDHPGSGGGYAIYINGQLLIENPQCSGRGHGYPKGAYITAEFLDDLAGQEVTIAVMSFIRYNDKFLADPTEEIRQGRISLHFERQLLPPMGDDLVRQSATLVPMFTSDWQANMIEAKELGMDDPDIPGMFNYDGNFVESPQFVGRWNVVNTTYDIDAFTPDMRREGRVRPGYEGITFEDDGLTDDPIMIWSGQMLMDMETYQALKMQLRTIDGTDYLFIEAGGFSTRNNTSWRNGWVVLQRQ